VSPLSAVKSSRCVAQNCSAKLKRVIADGRPKASSAPERALPTDSFQSAYHVSNIIYHVKAILIYGIHASIDSTDT
jgi:hypothetical protein